MKVDHFSSIVAVSLAVTVHKTDIIYTKCRFWRYNVSLGQILAVLGVVRALGTRPLNPKP
jgi:hypothetical protein